MRRPASWWRTFQKSFAWKNPESALRRQVFTEIFEQNAWGDPESVSGPGSNVARASLFRTDLEAVFRRLNVRTLLDVPCGDFNWLSHFDLGLDLYIGVDIVPKLIARNRAKFGSKHRRFLVRDMVHDLLPRADLIFCRDALMHLSHSEIFATLRNFKKTGSFWLVTSTFVDHDENPDLSCPGWRPLNLQAPPFALPPPVHLVDEQCLGYGGVYRDKRLAAWRLCDVERIAVSRVAGLPAPPDRPLTLRT